MKKKKIGYYILFILFLGIFINSFIAYISYKEVLNGKDPKIKLSTSNINGVITYNELLFKIKKYKTANENVVDLKLFFL